MIASSLSTAVTRALATAAVVCLSIADAGAQAVTSSILFDDYGFTQALSTSARATALGGACVATSDDLYGLMFNPAGLARVKRIELGMGIQQERVDVENTFFGTATGVDRRAGGIESAGIAIPLPTYRGSFVAAFGVHRLFSGELDLGYRGDNPINDTFDDYLLQQTGGLYSYDAGFGVDLSPALSAGMALFVIDGTISALEQYKYAFNSANPGLSVFVTDERALEVDGFGARVGAQFYFHRRIRAGFMFQSPVLIKTTGTSFTQITESVDNGIGTFAEFDGTTDAEFVLPFQIEVGAATTVGGATVSLQMGYADWSEASIDRKRLRAATLETVFREVFDFRAGLEYTLPRIPLRVRAGYAYRPYPLKFVQGDRIDEEDLERATFDNERRQFSFGAGALVGSVMTIDAAYERQHGARTISSLTDSRVAERYLLTAAYRF